MDEAIAPLATMHRASMTNLVLADKKTIAVAEVTPERIVVRGPDHGCCVCTNHYCTEKLKPIVPLNVSHSFQRYEALARVANSDRPLGLCDIQKGLHAARDDEETLQAMIFEPAALRLHLAIGRRRRRAHEASRRRGEPAPGTRRPQRGRAQRHLAPHGPVVRGDVPGSSGPRLLRGQVHEGADRARAYHR